MIYLKNEKFGLRKIWAGFQPNKSDIPAQIFRTHIFCINNVYCFSRPNLLFLNKFYRLERYTNACHARHMYSRLGHNTVIKSDHHGGHLNS